MSGEYIHYEALRKQNVMDRRSAVNIRKKYHTPPYQPFYVPYELPKDDIYVPREHAFAYTPVIEAKPTIQSFTPISYTQPARFMSMRDVHGNSSAVYRQDNENYSAKLKNRYKNTDYISQW